MSETCPACGFCPACKRSNRDSVPVTAPTVAPNPYAVGYWCHCGMWVGYGQLHTCWHWTTTPWGPVWTSNGTNQTTIIGNQP